MRSIVAFALVIVAIAVTVGALLELSNYMPSGPDTCCVQLSGNVTAVNFTFNGPTNCWSLLSSPGFALLKGGGMVTFFQSLTYPGGAGEPSTCTVQSVSITTPGFVFVRSNVPVSASARTSAQLYITVTTPSVSPSYSTTLGVNANVTSP